MSHESQRGRALIIDMKRAAPKHSHISQAYPGLNLDFLPTLTEGHLGLSGAPKPPLVSLKIHAEEDLSVPGQENLGSHRQPLQEKVYENFLSFGLVQSIKIL